VISADVRNAPNADIGQSVGSSASAFERYDTATTLAGYPFAGVPALQRESRERLLGTIYAT
jgi:hypothetical protein